MKDIRVLSAKKLSDESKGKIEKSFAEKFGDSCKFNYEIDSTLIGGIKVMDGSVVYDGSISGKLETIKQILR